MEHEHPMTSMYKLALSIVHDQRRPTWSLRNPSWTSQSGETCSTRSVATLQKWSQGENMGKWKWWNMQSALLVMIWLNNRLGRMEEFMDSRMKSCCWSSATSWILLDNGWKFKTSTPGACTAPGRLRRNKWNQLGIRPSTCQDRGNMAAELQNFLNVTCFVDSSTH